jgi:hypothetical protein
LHRADTAFYAGIVMKLSFVSLFVAAALAGLPAFVSADTIEYSTSGYFGINPANTSVSSGGESLSFTGHSDVTVNSPTIASLGDFTPSFGAAGTSGAFDGDLFTLLITQITNGSPSAKSVTGVLSGGLSVSAAGAQASFVQVNFGNGSVAFPEGNGNAATYTPFNMAVGTQTSTIQGTIISNGSPVTPLPKSAYGIAGLFGLVAFRQLLRR